jgi:uncharacterized lipoprotein
MTVALSRKDINELTKLLIEELEMLSDDHPQDSVQFVRGMINLAKDPNFEYADWNDSKIDDYLGPSLGLKDDLHFAWKQLHKLLDKSEMKVAKAKREYKRRKRTLHDREL